MKPESVIIFLAVGQVGSLPRTIITADMTVITGSGGVV
jgi:hypothetical protein